MEHRCDVPAPVKPRTPLGSAAADRPADTEHGVQFCRGKRPVTGRHRAEHFGIELDLVQGHIVVNTKIDLSGNRAHLP